MAHERIRSVTDLYKKLSNYSPIVGIFGHRQVGKTTLSNQLAKYYLTFDDKAVRLEAEEDVKLFLKNHASASHTLVIDECQHVPDLFPALKEYVRTKRRPGQFLLTGSVRFTSRRAIRESLAGRIATLELYPLTLSELGKRSLPDILPNLLELSEFDERAQALFAPAVELRKATEHLKRFLENGGLPGLCFLRNKRLRAEALLSILHLILDRDLRMVLETRLSFETLEEYLRHIARLGFKPYQAAKVSRELGLSHKTQKNLLFALESIFLVRRIRQQGKKGFLLLLEDQFEEFLLSDRLLSREDQLLGAFFRNARAQFQYRLGHPTQWSSFTLRSGARIPLVLSGEGKQLGFALVDRAPSLSQARSANSFLRRFPNGKMVFLLESGHEVKVLDSRILQCPIAGLL